MRLIFKKLFLKIIVIFIILFLNSVNDTKCFLFVKRRILIPFYIYPNHWDNSYQWKRLIETNKQTEIWVIINPDNGPGETINPDYEKGLSDININGIKILCYIPTNYGKRDLDRIKDDVDKYLKFYKNYNLFGIFYDEVNSSSEFIFYYKEICNYAKEKGFNWIILNPGISIDEEFLKEKVGDTIVIFEDSYLNFLKHKFPDYVKRYPNERFAILVHDVKNLEDSKTVINKSENIGFIYCTDDSEPNPWDTFPSYWNDFVELFYIPKAKE